MKNNLRILIIDDEEANRYLFSYILKGAGYEVIEAVNGLESLSKLEPAPDLILLDINLPDINGFEICKQIKQSHLNHIPIIQTSASFLSQADHDRGITSGADAYLISPVDPRDLLECVNTLLRK